MNIDIAFNDIRPETKIRTFDYPTNHTINNYSDSWSDSLLESPIWDFRKYAVWRTLVPYLINIRKLSYYEAFIIMKDKRRQREYQVTSLCLSNKNTL